MKHIKRDIEDFLIKSGYSPQNNQELKVFEKIESGRYFAEVIFFDSGMIDRLYVVVCVMPYDSPDEVFKMPFVVKTLRHFQQVFKFIDFKFFHDTLDEERTCFLR